MINLDLHRTVLSVSFVVCFLTMPEVRATSVSWLVSRTGVGDIVGNTGGLVVPDANKFKADTIYFLFREADTTDVFKDSWDLRNAPDGKVIIFQPETAGQRVRLESANVPDREPYFSLLVIPDGNSSRRIRVIMRDMIIVNQTAASGANDAGRSSLFRLGDYHSLTLEHDSLDGLGSARMPLIRIGNNATFNVSHSGIHNVSISGSTNNYPIIESSGNTSVINIENSRLKGWTNTGSSSVNRDMFNLGTKLELNITNSRIESCNIDACLIRSGRQVNITGSVFVGNTALKGNDDAYAFIYQTNGDLSADRCLFDNNKLALSSSGSANRAFYANADNGSVNSPEFTNCTFSNNQVGDSTARGSRFFFTFRSSTGNETTIIKNCTFAGNSVQSSSANANDLHFIYVYDVGGNHKMHIVGNSFINNTLKGGFDRKMIAYTEGNIVWAFIVNNTFSGNTGASMAINITDPYGGVNDAGAYFVNNTIYNSGNVTAANAAEIHIYNNLLFGTSKSVTVAGSTSDVARNIFNNLFYETGISVGEPLDGGRPTEYYVDANLSFATPSGAATVTGYHAIKPLTDLYAVLRQGGLASAVNNATVEGYLATDQRGEPRPSDPSPIAVGSYDRVEHSLDPRFFVLEYDPDLGLQASADFDITDALHLYNMFALKPTTAELYACYADSIQPDAGTAHVDCDTVNNKIIVRYFPLTRSVGGLLAPEIGTVGKPFYFTYRVKLKGITRTGIVNISIVNVGVPSGIINEGDKRCQAPMNKVKFEPLQKWSWWTANGYDKSADVNYRNRNTDGYSIPLVADLNGDGRPEVISLGNDNQAPGEHVVPTAYATYIYIINGQTGKTLSQLSLPVRFQKSGIGPDVFHCSPSYIAVADVDNQNDGKTEIIMAMGWSGNSMYDRRLICYDVKPKTFELTQRWISDTPYDESANGNGPNNYYTKSRPLPQIVNFDQAGAPEILVYNKIYDAKTGKLKVKLEEIETNSDWLTTTRSIADYCKYAYTGRNRRNGYFADGESNFASVYDLDGDGNMEVIAGGKVYYDINPSTGAYKVKSADAPKIRFDPVSGKPVKSKLNPTQDSIAYQPVGISSGLSSADGYNATTDIGVGDGFTAVADIDGDGLPDIVVASLLNPASAGFHEDRGDGILRIQVWDPGLATLDTSGKLQSVTDKEHTPPTLKARTDIPFSIIFREGSVSPIYIGDIDGLRQSVDINGKKKNLKLPEISILGGRFYNRFSGNSPVHTATIPMHPNTGLSANYQFAYTYGGSDQSIMNTARGALMSWTWDADPSVTDISKKLKVSFLMEHQDMSLNTGFSFFDFDNDGTQEIVYRDQFNLQVISVKKPIVKWSDQNDKSIYRFRTPITSYTAFEYPTIADVDGDGSADIIVQGSRDKSQHDNTASVYVFSAKPGNDRWAPAPAAWNQFHYNPLKIYESMSVPRKNLHPLSAKLAFTKGDDVQNGTMTYLYNSNIMQVVKSTVNDRGVLETRAPIPDLRIMSFRLDTVSNPGVNAYIVCTVRNYGNAAANAVTPVNIYDGVKDYVPANLHYVTTLGEDLYPYDALKNPQETVIKYPVQWDHRLNNFTIRLCDASTVNGGTVSDKWRDNVYWRDCNWADNEAEAGFFVVRNDAYTVIQRSVVEIDFMKNDSIPAIYKPVTLTPTMFKVKGTADYGRLTGAFGEFAIENNKLYFTAPATFRDGVVELEYLVSDHSGNNTRNGNVYIFVVQSCKGWFITQKQRPYTFCLRDYPAPMPTATTNTYGVTFTFYETPSSTVVLKNSPDNGWLTVNPTIMPDVWVKPKVLPPDLNNYNMVDFPRAKITLQAPPTGSIYLQPNIVLKK